MSGALNTRGGAPVGRIADLDGIDAACVIYWRLWSGGPQDQAHVWEDFTANLGTTQGRKALKSFEDLCMLCRAHGRRPLMRHALTCACLGSDEACFANFITTAATGEREDAMLIATLLVRPDVAPLITALAADFGHALMRMTLAAPRHLGRGAAALPPHTTTIH